MINLNPHPRKTGLRKPFIVTDKKRQDWRHDLMREELRKMNLPAKEKRYE